MKKNNIIAVFAVGILMSCTQEDIKEFKTKELDVKITNAVITKDIINENTLPSNSEIGLFVTDDSGLTYDGSILRNIKYTATGEGDAQKWNAASDVLLSATVANVNSYYPYDESVTDITSIPIEVTSEVQKDWMWGTPVSGMDNKNYSATINMNHALAAVKLNIKKENYFGAGKVTSVSFNSNGAGTSAIMNATTGALADIKGAGYTFESTKEFTIGNEATSVSFIAVPIGIAAPLIINFEIDGKLMSVQTPDVTLLPGNIYECNLSCSMQSFALNKLNVTKWTVEQMGNIELQPFSPLVEITGTTTGLKIEYEYKNTKLIVKAIPEKQMYPASTSISIKKDNDSKYQVLKSLENSFDSNNILCFSLSGINEKIEIKFGGVRETKWTRIQHIDGTLYTADEWQAAEAAGTVTIADFNGIAVRYSTVISCPHIFYPITTKTVWSNASQFSYIPEMLIVNSTTASQQANGDVNTSYILNAIEDGSITDAVAATMCSEFTFPNGQKGYLPSLGEVKAWKDNGAWQVVLKLFPDINSSTQLFTSSLYSNNRVWTMATSSSPEFRESYFTSSYHAFPATQFIYDPANEYANK